MHRHVIFYDASRVHSHKQLGLTAAWWAGAQLYRMRSNYAVVPVVTWRGLWQWLADAPLGSVDSAQFWGHGSAGDAFIGEESLADDKAKHWCDACERNGGGLRSGATFWFRTCDTGQDRSMLRRMAQNLEGRVVAHTERIPDLLGFQRGAVYVRYNPLRMRTEESKRKHTVHMFSGRLPAVW